jgi:hypothetical protein
MKINTLIAAACAIAASTLAHAESPEANHAPPTPSAVTYASTPIEEVVEATDKGYRFDAFIVRWNGARVLVSDPLGVCHLGVGDTLRLRVAHLAFGETRLLKFMVAERDAQSGTLAASQPKISSDFLSGTATIQEVLSAEDQGFRFHAYLAKWRDSTIAIEDIAGATHDQVGESVSLAVVHASVNDHETLAFALTDTQAALAQAKKIMMPVSSHEQAIVEEVISGSIEGKAYRAYLARWQSSQIGVPAYGSEASYAVGDSIPLNVVRTEPFLPPSPGAAPSPGHLYFSLDQGKQPAADSAATENTNYAGNSSTATGSVSAELTAQSGTYRYHSYLVSWHDSRIIVDDLLGQTQHKAGDSVTFLVTRAQVSGRNVFTFMAYEPPRSAAGIAPASAAPVAEPASAAH